MEDRFDIVATTDFPALRHEHSAQMLGSCKVGEQPTRAKRVKGRGVPTGTDRSADDLEKLGLSCAELLKTRCDLKFFREDRHSNLPC
ncbi:hypothetical protein ASE65_00115 [Sphingomonas sp. Leaf16]|nr:hypothetical protein ASE65_00115 [Sphingomonas sp. Leaf16]KQN16732.1 hypothetical protein ASE81_16760 [Sphingomonas sp. Leaf29]KQN23360.1 hypothetical protein ASE83_02375 [Sphingomonas sp. Leaf32]